MQSPLSRRVLGFLERGLPAVALEAGDRRRRSLLVAGQSYVLATACLISLPVIAATMTGPSRVITVAVLLVITAVSILVLRLLQRGVTPQVAGSLTTFFIGGGIIYAIFVNGGFASPYWILLPLLPLVATQMAGRAAGLVWAAIAVASVAALAGLERLGVAFPTFTAPEAVHATAALYGAATIVTVHVLGYLADLAKDDAIARSVEASSRLERADLEVERARVVAQQAVAASTAKSAFMTTMSHELRTPLNAVIGYAELLVEEAEERGLVSMRNDLLKVVGASQHLLGLIEDILDLSRVEADRIELRRERFVAQEVVREVCEALEPLARKRKNALETRFDATPLGLMLDRGRLRQVLLNLIGNAIKFTSAGRVTVHARAEPERRGVVLAVEDTGIGIDEGDLQRIFEPFTQVDSSPRRRYEGSGVGLSLCKRLVETMGGTIAVRSQLGRGSTFTVWLPVEAPGPAERAAMDVAC